MIADRINRAQMNKERRKQNHRRIVKQRDQLIQAFVGSDGMVKMKDKSGETQGGEVQRIWRAPPCLKSTKKPTKRYIKPMRLR